MARVLIPLAEGVEEMEAVVLTDTLRRAQWDVVLAGLEAGVVTASRGVMLHPDTTWDEINPLSFDMLVLPGGAGGAARLAADARVMDALHAFDAEHKWVAAICAAPAVILHAAGMLRGHRATCYPGLEDALPETEWQEDAVVVDGHIVTSRGPGTALDFALALIRLVDGGRSADAVAAAMLAH